MTASNKKTRENGRRTPCSPLFKGVTDPLQVLRIASDNPVLLCSEPSQIYYPLEEKGWTIYRSGRWCITDEGRKVLGENPAPPEEPKTLTEFFDL